MALARTQYVRSSGTDIAYQVIGDGPRDVVVALDWASHLEALPEQPFIAEWFTFLARFARVLWFDMRGVGMSGPLSEDERYGACPQVARKQLEAILALDVREALPLVEVSTLVIHSRDNVFARIGHGRYLAEHIRGARLLERDNADHWPVPEPDLIGAIEEFVTGSRTATQADRVLATVLFVDVVGSTEYAVEVGGTARGASPSSGSRRRFVGSSTPTTAGWRPQQATACSRPSTGPLGRSAVRGGCARSSGAAGSRFDAGCTRAK